MQGLQHAERIGGAAKPRARILGEQGPQPTLEPVRDLEQREYITRRTDPSDLRRMLVSLSDRGAALFELVAPDARAVYRSIRDVMGTEKLRQLQSLLVELDEKVSALTFPPSGSQGLPADLVPLTPPKARGRPRKVAG